MRLPKKLVILLRGDSSLGVFSSLANDFEFSLPSPMCSIYTWKVMWALRWAGVCSSSFFSLKVLVAASLAYWARSKGTTPRSFLSSLLVLRMTLSSPLVRRRYRFFLVEVFSFVVEEGGGYCQHLIVELASFFVKRHFF